MIYNKVMIVLLLEVKANNKIFKRIYKLANLLLIIKFKNPFKIIIWKIIRLLMKENKFKKI